MNICEEMKKYRSILDEVGIHWDDASDGIIIRTHFRYGRTLVSVVNGKYSYGGPIGLLEVMVGGEEPEGWLTAEGVVKHIEMCLGRKLKELVEE